jgi:hypothetical protein
MVSSAKLVVIAAVVLDAAACVPAGPEPPAARSPLTIDLAQRLDAGQLRAFNRQASRLHRTAVRLPAANDNGVAWLEGTDFSSGTIEVDVRGKESADQRFVGVAFHRQDDMTYEAVYLRPFNFRATDSLRKQHAVQYIKMPDYDYDRLREKSPEEFENPVDAAIEPDGWVTLRIVVEGGRIRIYVGPGSEAALEVRKLGQLYTGQVGLWVGNDSGGDFANFVIAPTR